MKKTLTFSFCSVNIYDNYLVVEMNEGTIVTPEFNKVLTEVTDTYFPEDPFIYITNRINSYSVDPKIYFETTKIKNLKGFAVVSKNYKAKVNAEIEKLFFNKPFEIFTKLEAAFKWASVTLK